MIKRIVIENDRVVHNGFKAKPVKKDFGQAARATSAPTSAARPSEDSVDGAVADAVPTSTTPTTIKISVATPLPLNEVARQLAAKFAALEKMVMNRSSAGIAEATKSMVVGFHQTLLADIKTTLLTRSGFDPTVKGAENLAIEMRYLLEAMRSAKMATEDYGNMKVALVAIAELYAKPYYSSAELSAFLGAQPPGGNRPVAGGAVPRQS